MAIGIVRLVGEPVVIHYLATDERLEREGGKHVEAEAQAGDLHYSMTLGREIVEYIPFRKGAKCEETRERHRKTGQE